MAAAKSIHEECTAHSGLEGKMKVLLTMVSAAVGLLLFQIGLTFNMKTELSTGLAEVRGDVKVLKQRVDTLEREVRND
jgi:hypothetical protein